MNATEDVSPVMALYRYQTSQPILSWDSPSTNETSIRKNRHRTLTAPASRTTPTVQLYEYSNILIHTRQIASALKIRGSGQTLAASLNEQTFWEVDSKYKKNITYQMYSLNDHGIEIALDAGYIQREALTSLCALYRCNYIKESNSPPAPCLKLNDNPEFSTNIMTVG